jgi:hypothetical protein
MRPLSACALTESFSVELGARAAAAVAGVPVDAAGELADSRRAASAPRQPNAARESAARTLSGAAMSVFERGTVTDPNCLRDVEHLGRKLTSDQSPDEAMSAAVTSEVATNSRST